MKTKESIKLEMPKIIVDKRLNEYSDKILFPEKVKKANEILKKCPPPKFL